jgi:cysteine desulfuration protein SufE
MTRLDEKVARFNLLGREMRLQLLLSHARKFPDLPEELWEARDAGLGRVQECQTPLFLWVGLDREGSVKIHADAPREAPTVRGFMAFLMDALQGAVPEEVAEVPEDLLDRMGLAELLGIMRTQGLNAVIRRVKHDVAKVG